ncbi:hypothetical protein Tco_0201013 [Tanacetum coccineum]
MYDVTSPQDTDYRLGPVWGCDRLVSEPGYREPDYGKDSAIIISNLLILSDDCSRDFYYCSLILSLPAPWPLTRIVDDQRLFIIRTGRHIPFRPYRTPSNWANASPSSLTSSSYRIRSPFIPLGLDATDQAHTEKHSTRDVSPRSRYPPRRAPRRSEAYRRWTILVRDVGPPVDSYHYPCQRLGVEVGLVLVMGTVVGESCWDDHERCTDDTEEYEADAHSTELRLVAGMASRSIVLSWRTSRFRAMIDIERDQLVSLRLHMSLHRRSYRQFLGIVMMLEGDLGVWIISWERSWGYRP